MVDPQDSVPILDPGRQRFSGSPAVPNRREALQMIGTAAALGWTTVGGAAEAKAPESKAGKPTDDALDEALRLIHKPEPQCRQGLSTHAPHYGAFCGEMYDVPLIAS
jgi:hypothetical protein